MKFSNFLILVLFLYLVMNLAGTIAEISVRSEEPADIPASCWIGWRTNISVDGQTERASYSLTSTEWTLIHVLEGGTVAVQGFQEGGTEDVGIDLCLMSSIDISDGISILAFRGGLTELMLAGFLKEGKITKVGPLSKEFAGRPNSILLVQLIDWSDKGLVKLAVRIYSPGQKLPKKYGALW